MKFLVWSVALYAAEMWMLTQTDSQRWLEALEMWMWRGMEKMSRLDNGMVWYGILEFNVPLNTV